MIEVKPLKTFTANGIDYTVHDLPDQSKFIRWTSSRKELVVLAYLKNLLDKDQILARYMLEEFEFDVWVHSYQKHGTTGLKTTKSQKLQTYRIKKEPGRS